jgi:hypothetical protein
MVMMMAMVLFQRSHTVSILGRCTSLGQIIFLHEQIRFPASTE